MNQCGKAKVRIVRRTLGLRLVPAAATPSSTYSSPLPSSLDWDGSAGDNCRWFFFHFVSDSSACVVFSVRFVGCALDFLVGGSTISASLVGRNASGSSHSTIKPGLVLPPLRQQAKKKKEKSKTK